MEEAGDALGRIRNEIDAIDDQIGRLLALRFIKTDEVGKHKATLGEMARDPQRQLQRKWLLHEMADRHQIPAALVFGLFRQIAEEVVSRHRAAGCRDDV